MIASRRRVRLHAASFTAGSGDRFFATERRARRRNIRAVHRRRRRWRRLAQQPGLIFLAGARRCLTLGGGDLFFGKGEFRLVGRRLCRARLIVARRITCACFRLFAGHRNPLLGKLLCRLALRLQAFGKAVLGHGDSSLCGRGRR